MKFGALHRKQNATRSAYFNSDRRQWTLRQNLSLDMEHFNQGWRDKDRFDQHVVHFPCVSRTNGKLETHKSIPEKLNFQSSQFLFFYFSVRLLSVLRGHSVFSSPPQRPITSDFAGFSIPDFIHYIYVPILILEKEPVFSILNVQC